jgi:hypothetical protein
MSRKYLPENVYSFTTTSDDEYLARVLEEVAADTDFVVITEHNTLSGESEKAALAVRKTITSLGYFFPSLKLAGKPLVDWFHEAIESIVDDADTNEFEFESISLDIAHWDVTLLPIGTKLTFEF